ncbi:MAG: hypothetical protein R3B84_14215 [Zavarzinella sp.]
MLKTVEYRGWKNNILLSNDQLELICTLDVGPRVISFRKATNPFNVMKNYDEMMGGTGETEWQIRGGLRFWIAPEDLTRTYFADNRPVQCTPLGDFGVRLTPPEEVEYGLQKVMEVRLAESGNQVKIRLIVTNTGQTTTRLAPWAPTVMAPGGIEILPQPEKRNHPGHPLKAKNPSCFGPNQSLVLWPYFDFTDSRWTFGSRFIFLKQDAKKGPTKIGFATGLPWVAYWNQGTLFVKKFRHHEWATYPDLGTVYQTFSNEDMLEMETVGILTDLIPGQSAELEEVWELYDGIPEPTSEAVVQEKIAPLLAN